ncbi:hypothetical protein L7F22_001013 [Adiantum nelumboides]|nr:hypothetical protein [Adiantum nelumboides]
MASLSFSIRDYDERCDAQRVSEVEKICEAGPSGSISLFTDLLGDPLCRVRHFPAYTMLVAEVHTGVEMEIVGMIRAGIKQVVCGHSCSKPDEGSEENITNAGAFASIAYILGLRVAPQYRRLGIAIELVKHMEAWCRVQGAQYTYIATEKDNEASVSLFTRKLGYAKFRTPAILVQPVYASSKRVNPSVQIVELSKDKAEALYRDVFKDKEFFPRDVDVIMKSKLHKGTWVAMWRDGEKQGKKAHRKHGKAEKKQVRSIEEEHEELPSLASSSSSWAVLSVWKCNEIFKLEVKGAPLHTRTAVATARLFGKLVKRLAAFPTPPNVFKPFGLQLVYGVHSHGQRGDELVRELCWFAHNLAKKDACAVVALEVGSCDPMRACIPHWASLSCDEDLWCIKRLSSSTTCTDNEMVGDWSTSPPPPSLFVDPRDF